MKLNIAYPAQGTQKCIDIEDEHRLRGFYEKRMGQEVEADFLGDEFKGYILKITGGNDKQGFPMKQGVMHPTRVRLLLSKDSSCYRSRRAGERKRKSVRGCIVSADLSVLSVVIVKQGDADIEGLTTETVPRRLGPKRANNIRKLFALTKEDDVRQYVIRREVTSKSGKTYTKAPKIQRLITPRRLAHKAQLREKKIKAIQASKDAAAEYSQLLAKRVAEKKTEKAEVKKRRASSLRTQSVQA